MIQSENHHFCRAARSPPRLNCAGRRLDVVDQLRATLRAGGYQYAGRPSAIGNAVVNAPREGLFLLLMRKTNQVGKLVNGVPVPNIEVIAVLAVVVLARINTLRN